MDSVSNDRDPKQLVQPRPKGGAFPYPSIVPSAPGGAAVDWSQFTRTAGLANHLKALIGRLGTTALQQLKHRWADQALLQELLVGLGQGLAPAEQSNAQQPQAKRAEGLPQHCDQSPPISSC